MFPRDTFIYAQEIHRKFTNKKYIQTERNRNRNNVNRNRYKQKEIETEIIRKKRGM